MKINFNQNLLNLDGKRLKINDRELTLLSISQNVLVNILTKEDETIASGEKEDRYNLALKITIHKEVETEVTAEDIVLLKKLIGKPYIPLVVGQAFLMLEGRSTGIVEVVDEVKEN